MDCRSIEPALPAAAAGALDAEEQLVVRLHVAECPRCADVVRSYEDTLALLAYAVPQFRPPVSLRVQVLARCSGQVTSA